PLAAALPILMRAPASARWRPVRYTLGLLLRQSEDVDGRARATLVDIAFGDHQRRGKACRTCRDGDVLTSVDLVGDGVTRGIRCQARTPQHIASFGVEGLEVTVATAGEQQVAGSGHHGRVLRSGLFPAPDGF